MVHRDVFSKLEAHLEKKHITVITGMRRVGKTTAIKHLLSKIEIKNKIYFDLEKIENRYIFQQPFYSDIEISLKIEGIDLDKKSYIAIDEIQLVPEITSVIKYFYDNYDIKFILSGSSSLYLKNHFSESLAGRKRIFEMYPLSFNEFLNFKGISPSSSSLTKFPSFNMSFYQKYKEDYKLYLKYGGFPEIALATTDEDRSEYLKDIINSYIESDIKILSDFSISKDLYKLIRLLANRIGSKVDYSKISDILGLKRNKVRDYIEFLEYTYFIRLIPAFVKNPDREISKQRKIYFTDNGLPFVLENNIYSQLLENSVANQLVQYGEVKYYSKKTGQEIDFILNDKIAIEVKETPIEKDLITLKRRSESIDIKDFFLIGLNYNTSGFNNFVWAGTI